MKVVHFEIPAEEPEKLGEFYKKVFDWKIEQWGDMPYWMVETGPKEEKGIGGAIYKKSDKMSTTVNTISVDNLEKYMGLIKESGGKVVGEIMDIPTVGRNVMALDPEGNLFGIIEFSEEAMKNMQ